MTFGKEIDGSVTLRLSPDEALTLLVGRAVVKRSSDNKGNFKITVKLTRPRTSKARRNGL